jgi:hypothetical protein
MGFSSKSSYQAFFFLEVWEPLLPTLFTFYLRSFEVCLYSGGASRFFEGYPLSILPSYVWVYMGLWCPSSSESSSVWGLPVGMLKTVDPDWTCACVMWEPPDSVYQPFNVSNDWELMCCLIVNACRCHILCRHMWEELVPHHRFNGKFQGISLLLSILAGHSQPPKSMLNQLWGFTCLGFNDFFA